jgi:hypothetical protein
MEEGVLLSARMVARLLAQIYGPSIYDIPKFGGGPLHQTVLDPISGPGPQPWQRVALNPQPLPPGEQYALTIADSHIAELQSLDRLGTLLGGEVAERTEKRAMQIVSEIDEICPRWPKWPKVWPPPPPPWPWLRDEMSPTELLVFGSRFLAAAELLELGHLQESVARLGGRAMELGTRG